MGRGHTRQHHSAHLQNGLKILMAANISHRGLSLGFESPRLSWRTVWLCVAQAAPWIIPLKNIVSLKIVLR